MITGAAALAATGLGAAVLDLPVAAAGVVADSRCRGFGPETRRVLQTIIASGAGAANVPGVNAGVWVHRRGRFMHSLGTSDLATGAPLQPDDHFRIASISKTFTATAILQLVDRRRMSLDDRLARYVKGIPHGDRITIAQLLGMTSGIYDYTADPQWSRAYAAHPARPFSLADVVAIIRRHRPLFAPGTDISYDNSNYYLLGAIAEQVSGRPLPELIEHRILRPLGMSHTSYPTTTAMPTPFSHGYLLEPTQIRDVTVSNPAAAGGAGAMISTLADLRVWAKALATGTLLTPASQALRLKTRVLAESPAVTVRYGLGIADFNGFLGHDGAILGYGSVILHLPEKDATIVVLGNQSGIFGNPPALFIGLALAAYLFPDRFPSGI